VVQAFESLPEGETLIAIDQGVKMGRASLIHLGLEIAHGALTSATIGGEAVMVGEGTIDL